MRSSSARRTGSCSDSAIWSASAAYRPAKVDDSIRGDQHRLEFFLPGVGCRVVQVVERVKRGLYVTLEVEHTSTVDLVVEHPCGPAHAAP